MQKIRSQGTTLEVVDVAIPEISNAKSKCNKSMSSKYNDVILCMKTSLALLK